MKKAVALVLLYIAAMAAGMAYVKNAVGVRYSEPQFIGHFFWILVGLAAITVAYCLVFRSDTALPFAPGRRWGMYLVVMIPIILVFVFSLVAVPSPQGALVPIAAALLIGIGEETVFRHVLFGALLKRSAASGQTVISAIIVSSVAFSLLHAVNVLGGQPVGQMVAQLVLTFLAGILSAGLYLQTRSLLSLIGFHWLWDAITFLGTQSSAALGIVVAILTAAQIVIGFVILWQYRRVEANSVLEAPSQAQS